MTDLATLGLRFKEDGYDRAAEALDGVKTKAREAEKAVDSLADSQKKGQAAASAETSEIDKFLGRMEGVNRALPDASDRHRTLNRMMGEATAAYRAGTLGAGEYVEVMKNLRARLDEAESSLGQVADTGASVGGTLLSLVSISALTQIAISAVTSAVIAANERWSENIDLLVEKIAIDDELKRINDQLATSTMALVPVLEAQARALLDQAAASRAALQAERDRLALRAQIALTDPNTSGYSRAQFRLDQRIGPEMAEADRRLLTQRVATAQTHNSALQTTVRDAMQQLDRGLDHYGRELSATTRAALQQTISNAVAEAQRNLTGWEEARSGAIARGNLELAQMYGIGAQTLQAIIQDGTPSRGGSIRSGGGGRGVSVAEQNRREAELLAARAAEMAQVRQRIELEDDLAMARATGDAAAIHALERQLVLLRETERYRRAGDASPGVTALLQQLGIDDATRTRQGAAAQDAWAAQEAAMRTRDFETYNGAQARWRERAAMDQARERERAGTFASGLGGYESQNRTAGAEAMERIREIQRMYEEIERLRGADLLSEQQASAAKQGLARMEADARLSIANEFFGNLASLQNSSVKELHEIGKAAALAQAMINTISAVTYALAGPFPMNLANAAVVGALGAAQIAKIQAMADGGWVSGPGGGRDDAVPAWLSNGEFVVNANAASRNRSVLEAINRGGEIPAEARRAPASGDNGSGGVVTVRVQLNDDMLEAKIEGASGRVAGEIVGGYAAAAERRRVRRETNRIR